MVLSTEVRPIQQDWWKLASASQNTHCPNIDMVHLKIRKELAYTSNQSAPEKNIIGSYYETLKVHSVPTLI